MRPSGRYHSCGRTGRSGPPIGRLRGRHARVAGRERPSPARKRVVRKRVMKDRIKSGIPGDAVLTFSRRSCILTVRKYVPCRYRALRIVPGKISDEDVPLLF